MTADEPAEGFDTEFGRRAAAARRQTGLAQRALADALQSRGITLDSAALSRIETGQRSPKLEEAAAIAEILGLPLTELLPARPEVVRIAEARQKTLKQLDDTMYKLTALAGNLEYFAQLVDTSPEIAREVFRDESPTGRYDWEGWASWAVDSLASSPHRRVVSTDDDRAHAIKRVLGNLAAAVVVAPIDLEDTSNGVTLRTRKPKSQADGEHQAAE